MQRHNCGQQKQTDTTITTKNCADIFMVSNSYAHSHCHQKTREVLTLVTKSHADITMVRKPCKDITIVTKSHKQTWPCTLKTMQRYYHGHQKLLRYNHCHQKLCRCCICHQNPCRDYHCLKSHANYIILMVMDCQYHINNNITIATKSCVKSYLQSLIVVERHNYCIQKKYKTIMWSLKV